jgi:hypothetical protein
LFMTTINQNVNIGPPRSEKRQADHFVVHVLSDFTLTTFVDVTNAKKGMTPFSIYRGDGCVRSRPG